MAAESCGRLGEVNLHIHDDATNATSGLSVEHGVARSEVGHDHHQE
jgi:hypothetical protein